MVHLGEYYRGERKLKMSGLRHGRETVFKATQITDKLCLAWGQRMSRREVQDGAAEGICGHRSESGAHLRGAELDPTSEEQEQSQAPPGCVDLLLHSCVVGHIQLTPLG